MIHIEKLFLKKIYQPMFVSEHRNSLGQTFVDYLNGVDNTPRNIKSWLLANINLTNHIKPALTKKIPSVNIGRYYGKHGIDLDQLLLQPPVIDNLVIEMPADYLAVISKSRLKILFETHTIMLNDFEEFGCLYGIHLPHIVTFLKEHNIKPKCLFLVGAAFQMDQEYKELNIYTIPFEYWLLVSASMQPFFCNAVSDSSYKDRLILELSEQPKKNKHFCAIPIRKPRRHRIALLSHLDKIGILSDCDWSCALDQNEKYNNFILPQDYDSRNVRNSDTIPSDVLTNEEINFTHRHNFPKELEFDELWKPKKTTCQIATMISSPDWFNQYKFILSSETYIGDEIDPIMGGCGTLSEKTFKSFLYGSSVIIHGAKGSTEQLLNLGFKNQFGNYDSSNVAEIGKIMQEIYCNPVVDQATILHNFDRITDLEFLTSLVASPLNTIAELINSIRR